MQIHIVKNGEKQGPYSEAQVREMLAAGSIAGTDLTWHEGLPDWVPLASILAKASAPAAPVSTMVPGVAVTDPNLAERGSRLGAALLDTLIMAVCVAPGVIILSVWEREETAQVIGVILLCVAVLGLFITQMYLLSTRGQSLGKRFVGVRIVKYEDNANPGFVHACLLRAIVPALIGAVPFVGGLFSIIDICFIFGEERRCIHDLIAGTKVVKA
jgi:uncharacterized RDD family membrane protein YckC